MKSLHLDICELEVKAFFVLNLVNIYPPREDHWGNFLLDLFQLDMNRQYLNNSHVWKEFASLIGLVDYVELGLYFIVIA